MFDLTRRATLAGAAAFVPLAAVHAASQPPFADIERRSGGTLRVAALDTGSGRRIGYRQDERALMCSTFKFMLVARVLWLVDSHKERLDRLVKYASADLLDWAPITRAHVLDGAMAVGDLCAAAIEHSDNTAANLLLGVVGGPPMVTAYARTLGDDLTFFNRTEPTLNVPDGTRDTTMPSAMVGNLQKILLGDALSPASRAQMTEWMIHNTTGDALLRAGLPASWQIGDKTGRGEQGATNDIAIAWPPGRSPVLVCVYTIGGKGGDEDRSAVVAEVGRVVASAFS
ncbi:MAG TPA: class A beta-lactamase [Rhizomicrobium sp.]|nr:class A beta-lactamase [Rhizomicrobium sp.]